MKLHQLSNKPGSRKAHRRKGRGPGSQFGKTAGRGQKGQLARGTVPRGFEGGQTPLHRRLPRRGFTNLTRVTYHIVNLAALNRHQHLKTEEEIDPAKLVACGLARDTKKPLKILAVGDLSRAIRVRAHRFSQSAVRKIEAAGGQAIVIAERNTPPAPQARD